MLDTVPSPGRLACWFPAKAGTNDRRGASVEVRLLKVMTCKDSRAAHDSLFGIRSAVAAERCSGASDASCIRNSSCAAVHADENSRRAHIPHGDSAASTAEKPAAMLDGLISGIVSLTSKLAATCSRH